MPYYMKKIALELYIPVAVEAEDEQEAKELIENINIHGKTIRIKAENIVELLVLREDIPKEISGEAYKKTSVKVHKGGCR